MGIRDRIRWLVRQRANPKADIAAIDRELRELAVKASTPFKRAAKRG